MQYTPASQLRTAAIAALQPVFVGTTVRVGDSVPGHDPEVRNQTAVCTAVSLLEDFESDIVLTLAIPGYGPADILLEELL